MSFDDYARHISHKYRLAISIAILNTKPDNLSIDEYLEKLKSKIIKTNINNDQNDDNNLMNISACSDDFNIHDSDENNDLNYNDQDYMNQNRLSNDLKGLSYEIKDHKNANECFSENQFNNKKRPRYDEILLNDEEMQLNNKEVLNGGKTLDNEDLNASTVLQNFEELIDAKKERREKYREVIQVLKGVDLIPMDQVTANETQRFRSDNLQDKLFDPMDLDLTQCYDDNYSTLSNSIHILTNTDKRGYEENYNENFETNLIRQDIRQQITQDTSTSHNNTDIINENEKLKRLKTDITKRMRNNKGITTSNTKPVKKVHSFKETPENNTNNKTVTENASNDSLQLSLHRNEGYTAGLKLNIKDSHHTLPDYSQYNTHYSASEMNEVSIDKTLIYGNINHKQTKDNANLKEHDKLNLSYQQMSYRESQNDAVKNIKGIELAFSLDTQKQYTNNESLTNQNDTCPIDFIDKAQNEENCNFIANDTTDQNQNMVVNDNTFTQSTSTHDLDRLTDKEYVVYDKTADIDNSDKEDKREKVPFKIIEEMNRIKVYLNRKKFSGCSSGYKSSQSFGYLRSTQPENLAIEQSAFSLFNYIATCPLVTPTHVLTEQISKVLGQLIDRLHEKEIYPPFLEELLNTIKDILKSVYEEKNYVFDVLLNKDEQVQRIILLNKSTHIQKFTIGKINSILQKLLDETSADTTAEIQNINRMENLCYIFHILQILIPKYKKNYLEPSQKSADDKILRKTDITNVWRKKWIANYKEITNEGSPESNCVLKECSENLNKIVVSFIDGYSLISFSALQCFNLLQSSPERT